ncbi:sensor histidine kinase [Pontibacillus yanchengensis]|uniref:Sensor histidine kinase n=2 Tax=Pontibacillus yanchengensis TaxID=462910 RepID=A0ACC7VCF7_9BACI|nr:sensor histidine kinase [Pontibacillus yanchengensis]MYL34739.1 sensor histidine kinase [Pontibacillus yanchengensis]MYL52275.1 sensor histidine kinase [Pontibacillus yanchengensis]
MIYLLLTMLERVGIIVTVAFLTTRLTFFKNMMDEQELQRSTMVKMMVFFGLFGIIGTYTGLSVDAYSYDISKWTFSLAQDEALANSRVIGVVIGGLLGGWKVGLGAGLLAGFHRFTLGGFTAIACGVASIVAGLLAGFARKKLKSNAFQSLSVPLIVGMVAETIQMGIILLVAQPFEASWNLVEKIGLPMIVSNGVGSALFILIIRNVLQEREQVGAEKTQKALLLAKLTTSHLRFGLNRKTAQETCEVIRQEVGASAVAITDQEDILGYVGMGHDHHQQGKHIQTDETKAVIETGQVYISRREAIHCQNEDCPLQSAVIAPLNLKGETIGTLKCYFESEEALSKVTIEYITGLAALLSQQLDISDNERVNQLAKDAEIRALQAQISPHFLFNALNTIVSMIRLKPDEARKLLVTLSRYLRQNINGTKERLISLQQELQHVKAYLSIEEARFNDKLHVEMNIDETVLFKQVPPMTLQPIMENAIKHGLKGMKEESEVTIRIHTEMEKVFVSIEDNGWGMEENRLEELLTESVESQEGTGIGLVNVNQRLTLIYGQEASLKIDSRIGEGTKVSFQLPLYDDEGDFLNE